VRALVVTADDFGAAREVNDAVELAHRSGILTAASLMVAAPATQQAIAIARGLPGLRVGLHLVLVEGRPMLPTAAVSELVNAQGTFRGDMATFGALLAISRRARRQLSDEITAQFEAFQNTGLALDHCNAHKHFHLHPLVASLILSIGRRFGLRSVRVPHEPCDVLRRIEPPTPKLPSMLIAPFIHLLRLRVRHAGMWAADQVFGLQWSGGMDKARLAALICHLPPGLTEIYVHPATGSYAGDAPGYRYREELEALMDPDIIAASRECSLRRGGFSDFECPAPGLKSLGLRGKMMRRSITS
jgi:chitin disaccharide deacetylase